MITYNNNDPRQTLIWSELYSAADAGGGIIADADYIIDRNVNKTQGLINSRLNAIEYKLIAVRYTDEVNSNPIDKVRARVIRNLEDNSVILDLGSVRIEYSFDGNSTWKSNISYDDWLEGVTIDRLNSESTVERPSVLHLRLADTLKTYDTVDVSLKETAAVHNMQEGISNSIGSINNIISDIQTNTYTKTEVNTMLESIEAGGSGDTNLQEANLQDIQAVFNMQYQQASPEVIDPHENP